MNYLYGYLIAGVVILFGMLVVQQFIGQPAWSWRGGLANVGKAAAEIREIFSSDIVVGVPGLLIIVALWPLILGMRIYSIWEPAPVRPEDEVREFAVTPTDLLEPVSLAEVEEWELVIDPLGVAPAAPFGHRHADWQAFRASLGPDDTLWTFSTYWKPRIAGREWRTGYVIVRSDGLGPWFVTLQKRLYIEVHRY